MLWLRKNEHLFCPTTKELILLFTYNADGSCYFHRLFYFFQKKYAQGLRKLKGARIFAHAFEQKAQKTKYKGD